MALNSTTLSNACAINDKSIVVASATGAVAGAFVRVDLEIMQITKEYTTGTTLPVIRGQDGGQPLAHPTSAKVQIFLGTDAWADGPGGPATGLPTQPARVMRSYSAAGAITLPTQGQDMVAVLNGTGALAMTLANPTADMDGCFLWVVGNGKAAHTLTYAAGLGNGGANLDVNTWAAGGQIALVLIAANAIWVPLGFMAGTLTNITITAS